ncbi:MAG TPA: hypothetical protein VEX66_14610 [Microlunatus sp.]|jgi:hypothetical protein|nr:hypothetical protein [Microlunatus sp.]
MTTFSSIPVGDALDPQLADLITEALVWSDDAAQRADALHRIVQCAVDALCWRLEPDGDPAEERSAQQLLLASERHRDRMRSVTA